MNKGKVIKFINKKEIEQEKLRKQRIIENAHFLIDSCKGDFAIVFKAKDIEYLFDDMNKTEFIIAMTDIKKIDVHNKSDYFFSGFSGSGNSIYFDLDS